ncbi:9151_t:CDS:2 [Funneliformis mosseae]|uniref:9151_t:CDS:1 n=1 Tax=Funneliformis mosseae TaxID=27381 RepID=A0A9N8VUW3_FUNMO|nr:9151_t:CDS:2 [Funneliformis mosseae]
MKTFATASGGATHIVESSNIAFRRHQEITTLQPKVPIVVVFNQVVNNKYWI